MKAAPPTTKQRLLFRRAQITNGYADKQLTAEIRAVWMLAILMAGVFIQIMAAQLFSAIAVLGIGLISVSLLSISAKYWVRIGLEYNQNGATSSATPELPPVKLGSFEGLDRRRTQGRRRLGSPMRQTGRRKADVEKNQRTDDAKSHG